MLVRELIAMLSNPDIQGKRVLLSKDPEGNRYWQVSGVELESFDHVSGYEPIPNEDGEEAVVISP